MESMKAIQWERCISKGAIGSYPPESSRMMNPGDNIDIGMHVTARYKDVTVHLEILGETGRHTYSAIVKFFEPQNALSPADLAQNEVVAIARDDICCIYEKK